MYTVEWSVVGDFFTPDPILRLFRYSESNPAPKFCNDTAIQKIELLVSFGNKPFVRVNKLVQICFAELQADADLIE